MCAADSEMIDHVLKIYFASLLLQIKGSMEGYQLPEDLMVVAKQVHRSYGCLAGSALIDRGWPCIMFVHVYWSVLVSACVCVWVFAYRHARIHARTA